MSKFKNYIPNWRNISLSSHQTLVTVKPAFAAGNITRWGTTKCRPWTATVADILCSTVLVWNAPHTDGYIQISSNQPVLPCLPWFSSGAHIECYRVISQNNKPIMSTIPDKHSNGICKQEGIVDAAKHSLIVRTICKQNTKWRNIQSTPRLTTAL